MGRRHSGGEQLFEKSLVGHAAGLLAKTAPRGHPAHRQLTAPLWKAPEHALMFVPPAHIPAKWTSVRRQGYAPNQRDLRPMALDDKTRTELEAAVFRRLVDHLRTRTDVQNIDLMNLAGFCRNCLSNWMKEEADKSGVALGRDESREAVYGMPFEEWKAKFQKEASADQKAAFDKTVHKH
jgi:hypothetical protein